jgi:hypothetical protein
MCKVLLGLYLSLVLWGFPVAAEEICDTDLVVESGVHLDQEVVSCSLVEVLEYAPKDVEAQKEATNHQSRYRLWLGQRKHEFTVYERALIRIEVERSWNGSGEVHQYIKL